METKELEEAIERLKIYRDRGVINDIAFDLVLSLAETHLAVMKAQGMPKEIHATAILPDGKDANNQKSGYRFDGEYYKGYNRCRTDFIAWLAQRVTVDELSSIIFDASEEWDCMPSNPKTIPKGQFITTALRVHILGQKGNDGNHT